MLPQPAAAYARSLRKHLPHDVHRRATSRLLWLPIHLALVVGGVAALAVGAVPLGLAWLVSLLIGAAFAGLTFLAHETLHGAIVKGRRWQRLIGAVAFLPFAISPRLWVAWHNRVHHGRTQVPDSDPDAFPTLTAYRNSRFIRFMVDHVGAARGARGGVLALLLGFTIQSTQVLLTAERTRTLSRRDARVAVIHTVLVWAGWLCIGLLWGWVPLIFGFAIPLTIANTIVMAYILTNHSLSPLTEVNDPLVNSLSVTVSPLVDWLSLGFGYHVEHHLYPWMSARHGPAVRAQLLRRWPERYQSMPLWRALRAVYSTPRVYADARTLIEPRTGRTWPTLAPGGRTASSIAIPSAAPLAADTPLANGRGVPRTVAVESLVVTPVPLPIASEAPPRTPPPRVALASWPPGPEPVTTE